MDRMKDQFQRAKDRQEHDDAERRAQEDAKTAEESKRLDALAELRRVVPRFLAIMRNSGFPGARRASWYPSKYSYKRKDTRWSGWLLWQSTHGGTDFSIGGSECWLTIEGDFYLVNHGEKRPQRMTFDEFRAPDSAIKGLAGILVEHRLEWSE